MTDAPIPPETTASGFALKTKAEQDELVVSMSGNGDMEAISALASYLKKVQETLEEGGWGKVGFDFSRLEFMNSSCFKSFVLFIDQAKRREPPLLIRFMTQPSFHWQRRSLEALRRLAMGIVTIESVVPSAPDRE